jgi:hypothetical protein
MVLDRRWWPRLFFRLFHPLYWPRGLRRAAMLTAPLALALWLSVVALATLALVLVGVTAPLAALWNRPQRHRRSYTDYAYTQTRRNREESLIRLDDPVVVSMPQPSQRRPRDERLEEDVAALYRRRAS